MRIPVCADACNVAQIFQGETTAPLYSFKNLEPETGYEITVSSVLNGFYSLSSPLITAYTMAETGKCTLGLCRPNLC